MRSRSSLAVATVVAVLVAAGCGADHARIDGHSVSQMPTIPGLTAGAVGLGGPAIPAADAVFSKDPYMGVACHVPNSIACDRVGLAVWLRRPAIAVSATVAGARLKLDDPQWSGPIRDGRRTMFAGFLQPAGLTTRLHVIPERKASVWLGNDAPSPPVRFRIDYGHGRVVVTRVSVWLAAGWG